MADETVALTDVQGDAIKRLESATHKLRNLLDAIKELSFTHLEATSDEITGDAKWFADDLHSKAMAAGGLADMALNLIDVEVWQAKQALSLAAKTTTVQ